MQILIVEDNKTIASNLADYLETEGHVVDVAHDGLMGKQFARSHTYDAILLDLGLPMLEGLTLCKQLREELYLDTPILILTARDTLDDKLAGFGTGADDYLVKPFALQEVGVRLTALYKRHHGKVTVKELRYGELVYEPRIKKLAFRGEQIMLPHKCLQLVEILLREPDRLFTRSEIECEVWGEEQESSDRLRYHLRLLRSALMAAGVSDPIHTAHGIGYRFSKPV